MQITHKLCGEKMTRRIPRKQDLIRVGKTLFEVQESVLITRVAAISYEGKPKKKEENEGKKKWSHWSKLKKEYTKCKKSSYL